MQSLELVNLKLVTYAQPISLSFMAFIEFCPLRAYIVDRSHVVNLLVDLSSLLFADGEGYGLKKGSSYMHIVWKHCLKLALLVVR